MKERKKQEKKKDIGRSTFEGNFIIALGEDPKSELISFFFISYFGHFRPAFGGAKFWRQSKREHSDRKKNGIAMGVGHCGV